ncbi:MAG TPA: replication-relaxation family protein [Devosiaceae bacterium]|nr:replication-relaxation family protein [Devosiaceae bacterium]
MGTEASAPPASGLPEATTEIVASLAQHRVLTTEQVRKIHLPDNHSRWAQQVLGRLRGAELVAFTRPPNSGQRLWFATERGVRLAREAHALEGNLRPLQAAEVAGQLRAHTLAVNEVGIAFLRAARKRGDECGPLSWRHEVAHPLCRGRGRRRRTLFADAVLTYLREEDGRLALEQRFLELDRATLTVDRLVAELARYAELHRAKGPGGEAMWKERYPRFPKVHCVLAEAQRPTLERRRKSVLALLHSHPQLAGARGPRISICLLDELRSEGPFAPIFREVREPERSVDWLGSAVGGQTGKR